MKTLLFNHKYQAFYITSLVFLPLIFFSFYSLEILKIQPQSEDTFTLTMKQFVLSQSLTTQTPPQTFEEVTQTTLPEEIVPKNDLKAPAKTKKHRIKKNKETLSKPLTTQNIQTQNEQIQNPTQENIENLNFSKDKNPFLEELKRIIQNMQDYPAFARKMRLQGVVMVQFLWLENKKLSELKILQSSGHKILDESALNTIQKASMYFPSYHKNVRIIVPISYILKR